MCFIYSPTTTGGKPLTSVSHFIKYFTGIFIVQYLLNILIAQDRIFKGKLTKNYKNKYFPYGFVSLTTDYKHVTLLKKGVLVKGSLLKFYIFAWVKDNNLR